LNTILKAARSMGVTNNLCIRVLDATTKEVVQEHVSHNTVTNSMLTGIAHYLTGDGVLNQGYHMLSTLVPRYISLGTMGLLNQEEDENGLPAGIGDNLPDLDDPEYQNKLARLRAAEAELAAATEAFEDTRCPVARIVDSHKDSILAFHKNHEPDKYPMIVWPKIPDEYTSFSEWYEDVITNGSHCLECPYCSQNILAAKQRLDDAIEEYNAARNDLFSYSEESRFADYMKHCPGYGSDGYDEFLINGRKYFGLGPMYSGTPIDCELISVAFPRQDISYRDIVPEVEAELPRTIDVVFSAMISTGALKSFRETGKDYIFITECGLWSKRDWEDSGENGLLAGYRIIPPNEWQRQMVAANLTDDGIRNYLIYHGNTNPSDEDIQNARENDLETIAQYNRDILKRSIIRVGLNQVVQVIWKIQLGSIDEFANMHDLRKTYYQIDE